MANGVLILAEHLRGELSEVTLEMLGVGRKVADGLKAPLHVLLLGRGAAALAPQLGLADKVFVSEKPDLEVLPGKLAAAGVQMLLEKQKQDLVLVAGTNLSMGVGAALADKTGLPFVNFCRSLEVADGGVVATSSLFGGKILSDVRLADGRGVVSAYPGSFPADAGKSDKSPAVETVDLALESPDVVFQRFIEPEAGDVDITKQDALVAVGRGMQTQDNLELAEELAQALNGAVCGSRPVIDQGWLPMARQVGKSGMTVKPRLYLALGISGAPEHWEGMQASKLIIAVNTDPKAPIFDFAHYGICGDALEIVPALTEKIKARKG